jgi:hypothetical protein
VPAATWQQGSAARAEAPGAVAKAVASVIQALETLLFFMDFIPGVELTSQTATPDERSEWMPPFRAHPPEFARGRLSRAATSAALIILAMLARSVSPIREWEIGEVTQM